MDIKYYFTTIIFITGFLLFLILKYKFGNSPLESKNNFYYKSFIYNSNNTLENIATALINSGFTNTIVDKENKIVQAKAKSSFSSWGEMIYIEVINKSNTKGQINFTSTCTYPLQIFDWGKNKSNFNKFSKELNKKT